METPNKVCCSEANCTLVTVLGRDEYFGSGRWKFFVPTYCFVDA
jgi:hypothetical protein